MPDNVQLDILTPQAGGGIQAQGDTAMRLLQSGMNINSLRTLGVLRKEEWQLFDTAVVDVARTRLVGVGGLISRGLSFNLPNALGTTQLEWETISDMTPAEVNMSAVADGERDRVKFEQVTMPIPIVHKDFRINLRNLESSRRLGQPLDTTQATVASRLVSEKVESILYNGVGGLVVGGSQVYGYRTHPNRKTGSLTAAWNTATGAEILADVIAMISALNDPTNNMFGPYGLYCSIGAGNNMMNDFKLESDKTIWDRVEELEGIDFIQPTAELANNEAILVQLTPDVVRMVDGIQPTTVQWESNGGMTINFKVMAIIVPQIRSTQTNQSGVAHYSV